MGFPLGFDLPDAGTYMGIRMPQKMGNLIKSGRQQGEIW